MKKTLLLILAFALLLCLLFAGTGCDFLDELDSFLDEDTNAQTAAQTKTPAQPSDQTAVVTTISSIENSIPDFVGMTKDQALSAADSTGVTVSDWRYKQSTIPYNQAWENAQKDYKSKSMLWKVTEQSSTGTNKVALTLELNVINTSNNADFRTILNQDNAGSSSFVNAHKGELVEFIGVIRITEQNSTYNYTYTIYGYDDARSHVGELFCFYNIDYHAVRICTDNYSKVDTSSFFHIVAEIKGFDANKGILLKPVGIDYIGPLN